VKSAGGIDGRLDLGETKNLGLRAIDGQAHEKRSQR
jgi:hypothetical protein